MNRLSFNGCDHACSRLDYENVFTNEGTLVVQLTTLATLYI